MALTQTQMAMLTKARTGGGSELGVSLDDAASAYLAARIVLDLGIKESFAQVPRDLPPFFGAGSPRRLRLEGVDFMALFTQLLERHNDADTYFYCLATLHKARLKYERILQAQDIPTIDQVGPRGLLQYGSLSPGALAGLLFWRKWMYDIDNRAGQETGYVFEPIIARAIGGVPYGAQKSPIRRGGTGRLGRQVDCIREQKAYEIKLRVTIAASGQGRWGEELEFPRDCTASGFVPVLIVLDPTDNPKMRQLRQAFAAVGGESYVGGAAWDHLNTVAGSTMSRFIRLYVHDPIESLLKEAPERLPGMSLQMNDEQLVITIGEEILAVQRDIRSLIPSEQLELPDDVDEELPD